MKRRVLNLLTALSLLLFIAVVGMLVRSEATEDKWEYLDGGSGFYKSISSSGGVIRFSSIQCPPRPKGAFSLLVGSPPPPTTPGKFAPTSWASEDYGPVTYVHGAGTMTRPPDLRGPASPHTGLAFSFVTVAYWPLAFPLLALPTARAIGYVSRRLDRRRSPGICVRCGYDLRATPERCPECGTAAGPTGAA
jgi:hypothetical protein